MRDLNLNINVGSSCKIYLESRLNTQFVAAMKLMILQLKPFAAISIC